MHITRRSRPPLALAALAALALASCAAPGDDADPAPTATPEITTEEAAAAPRLTLTYDGGIQVLDATTLELVADIALDGFNRVNPAGDERHVLVSTAGGFQVLDAGSWAEPHGDHSHYYSTAPSLLDVTYPAQVPGHVVVHHGRTALFDDGTGHVVVVDAAGIAEEGADMREYTTPSAHHGVAVELSDGTLVITEGTEDARTGIRVLDASDGEIAASDSCPGVHGETVTDDEHVVVGCEDGVLVYRDGTITKVDSPDDYGRIGNLRAIPGSTLVLGDYGTDPEGGPLTQVALIDTAAGTMTLLDLGTEYTFRSLAVLDGHALVLGTDGALHVIDPVTATVERTLPVLEPWEVPADWQQPRPVLLTLDGSAYVTDPGHQRILAIDVETGEVWNDATLDVVPNEIVATTGDVVPGVSAEHEHGDDEHGDDEHGDHDDEDHSHEEDHDH